MTVKLESLKADLELESEGEWIDYPDWPGASFYVRSLETPAYKIARDMLVQKLVRRFKGKPIPPEVTSKEYGRLYAEHILRGWRGFDAKYTPDVAMQTLTDPAYRKMVAAVEWCAAQVGDAEVEFVEDAEKNSGQPSATT